MRFGTARGGRRGARYLRTVIVAIIAAIVVATPPGQAVTWAAEERPPAPGARSAIVVDAETGAVLYERNARAEYAPASLTKMVTALVAIERATLDRPVRATHQYQVVPVLIGLEPGDELRLEDAVAGLLIESGNDVALAIAEAVADGSSERFVGWMNELAGRLGLKNTRFKNPHGLDQDGHVSSAYDMAVIGRALMRNSVLARIVAERRHEVVGPPRWVFRTRNPLLGLYPGVDGIKTGFDDLAGLCLVATAVQDDRRAIAVVMNSSRYGDDAASLLDHAFADARWGAERGTRKAAHAGVGRVAMLRADLASTADGAPTSLSRAGRLLRSAEQGSRP
jgi:serine-type D-Ala-D-Ala carboxypeptidase (penicillin-binding protein 5/6)